MSAPIPRFVIVRASAAILGLFLVAAGVFFAIRYLQRQSESLDRIEAQREKAIEGSQSGSKDPPGGLARGTRGSTRLPNRD